MRPMLKITWASAVLALLAMIVGHLDAGRLSPVSDEISLYVVKAPFGGFIEASILLSAVSLFLVGILITRHAVVGSGFLAHLVPFLAGAAASGLYLIARFEETAPTAGALKKAGLAAVRVQSFHDAGFLLFFNSAILLAVVLGLLVVLNSGNAMGRAAGFAVAAMGPLAHIVMRAPWPGYVGLRGVTVGAHERAALLCLWLAVVLALLVVTVGDSKEPKGSE
jgi:hypothetical protein